VLGSGDQQGEKQSSLFPYPQVAHAAQVIRHYHGHLSGIYACAMHPNLDVLFTGGRDACIRVWDMRTRQQIMMLEGHSSAVWDIKTATVDPQVIRWRMCQC
jgi:pleiotropic regulator 1